MSNLDELIKSIEKFNNSTPTVRQIIEKEKRKINKENVYISEREYLGNKGNTIVGYALLVQDNIKKGDFARLNTGNIVKVLGIKENNVNKKAIYYGPTYYEDKWFDCMAVKNFSNNIIDLIEQGDLISYWWEDNYYQGFVQEFATIELIERLKETKTNEDIEWILTKEQIKQNRFNVE